MTKARCQIQRIGGDRYGAGFIHYVCEQARRHGCRRAAYTDVLEAFVNKYSE